MTDIFCEAKKNKIKFKFNNINEKTFIKSVKKDGHASSSML